MGVKLPGKKRYVTLEWLPGCISFARQSRKSTEMSRVNNTEGISIAENNANMHRMALHNNGLLLLIQYVITDSYPSKTSNCVMQRNDSRNVRIEERQLWIMDKKISN